MNSLFISFFFFFLSFSLRVQTVRGHIIEPLKLNNAAMDFAGYQINNKKDICGTTKFGPGGRMILYEFCRKQLDGPIIKKIVMKHCRQSLFLRAALRDMVCCFHRCGRKSAVHERSI